MRRPTIWTEIPIEHSISQNVAKAFLMNDCVLEWHCVTGVKSKCGGLFCDRQRTMELLDSTKGCGCYAVTSRRSGIVLMHDISILNTNIRIEEFCSMQFNRLFLDSDIASTVQMNKFDSHNQVMLDLEDSIEASIDYINNNGGFTITGWYRKGKIMDSSNNESTENEIESGKVHYHITNIVPTDDHAIQNITKFQTSMFNDNH